MISVVVNAKAKYPYPIDAHILNAIVVSVAAHLRAYGLEEVVVGVGQKEVKSGD